MTIKNQPEVKTIEISAIDATRGLAEVNLSHVQEAVRIERERFGATAAAGGKALELVRFAASHPLSDADVTAVARMAYPNVFGKILPHMSPKGELPSGKDRKPDLVAALNTFKVLKSNVRSLTAAPKLTLAVIEKLDGKGASVTSERVKRIAVATSQDGATVEKVIAGLNGGNAKTPRQKASHAVKRLAHYCKAVQDSKGSGITDKAKRDAVLKAIGTILNNIGK